MNELSASQVLDWRGFVARWMLVSLALHLVTAYFSVGYHSADEYFQILEFLNYKLGGTPAYDLPVEFREQMRPWMQPFVYWLMTKVWQGIGVTSPFTWAFSFRVLSGLIGWLSVYALALRARDWFASERAQRFCVMGLALIWFFPALHVRPSSESLGGSAFLLAMALVAALTRKKSLPDAEPARNFSWLACGAILGLSFEFRFQMGLMVAGLFAWCLFVARVHLRPLLYLLLGFGVIFLAGRAVDYWGYGTWVMSPWRYVEYNLLRGEVNRFGQSPVWDVFRMSFTESWPFIGLALAICTLIAWVRHPLHILTWSQVPFFAIHEIIAHKELRFFFPIAMAGPVLLTLSLVSRHTGKFLNPDRTPVLRWVWRFLLVNNFLALFILLFVPFSRTAQFYEGVSQLVPAGAKRFEIYFQDRDPYKILGNPVYFYRSPGLVTVPFSSFDEIGTQMATHPGEPVWLFHPRLHLPQDASAIAPHCEAAFRTLPVWISHIDFGNWLERVNVWTLFRCQAH